MSHKTVAYLRVSTADQDVEKNKATLLALANDKDLGKVEFIEETISGKVMTPPHSGGLGGLEQPRGLPG